MKKNVMGKRLYSPREAYHILRDGFRMFSARKKAEKNKTITTAFSKRLILAVTEVNGCAMCSYFHAQAALENGMAESEIKNMLAGELKNVPKEELSAVLFAQAYADRRGKPSKVAWEKIIGIYGKETAIAILSVVRMIMIGNTYGIPFGSLKGRLSRKKENIDTRSSIGYEAMMLLTMIPFLIVAYPHALLSNLTKQPLIK